MTMENTLESRQCSDEMSKSPSESTYIVQTPPASPPPQQPTTTTTYEATPRSNSPHSDTETMLDSGDFRSLVAEPTYQTLNGRMTPPPMSYNTGSYATLTPLQPLPPISTVSDKLGHAIAPIHGGQGGAAPVATLPVGHGSFAGFMQNTTLGHNGLSPVMDCNGYRSYEKLSAMQHMGPTTLATSPMTSMMTAAVANGYGCSAAQQAQQALGAYPSAAIYAHSQVAAAVAASNSVQQHIGLSPQHGSLRDTLVKQEEVVANKMLSSVASYEGYARILSSAAASAAHLSAMTTPPPPTQTPPNGASPLHPGSFGNVLNDHHGSPKDCGNGISGLSSGQPSTGEEINTKELAQKISSELKRYSIPQAVFAQRVLCRSQGTLSDLLRNPKPWSKLKSGRETFRRMWKWLQEPEFQRMSSLRLAGCYVDTTNNGQPMDTADLYGVTGPHALKDPQLIGCPMDVFSEQAVGAASMIMNSSPPLCIKRKDDSRTKHPDNAEHIGMMNSDVPTPKKPRLVFTDIQRRTLLAIFKETKRPSKEMQATIAEQLGLKVSTVANFFMNARRRSFDKYQEDPTAEDMNSAMSGMMHHSEHDTRSPLHV